MTTATDSVCFNTPPKHAKTMSQESGRASSRVESVKANGSLEASKLSTTTCQRPQRSAKPRKQSTKKVVQSKPVELFDHLPDKTEESCSVFSVIEECLYGSKSMGSSDTDTLDCDCSEDWHDGKNHACGEDTDCINRLTKMECVGGSCGIECQNQRFQQKQYADVSVFQTEKKGYGLRCNSSLQPNDFVFEYIGEVVNEPTFRKRMRQYDAQAIKHFYFMSLTKSEFIDATKKGNLGRFCNHSCNPNCYVDKWVVGGKLRMGIFAGRAIQAGEELVFDYNVDRYGAEPQQCFCGEPNCNGFIGGRTQTEVATKLNNATIEALGIDDGDMWESAVKVPTKRNSKRKRASATDDDNDDVDYVDTSQPRSLTEEDASKVMAALLQCKEKWVAVKLLTRIQNCDDQKVINRIARIHAYQIFKSVLTAWSDDCSVILQVFAILERLPRVYKNKITDSKIEGPVEELARSQDLRVAAEAKKLLDIWNALETVFRIPRAKNQNRPARQQSFYDEWRSEKHSREEAIASRPKSPQIIDAPKGPKSNIPQRNPNMRRRPFGGPSPSAFKLPYGWFTTRNCYGRPYYYTKTGQTSWVRPTRPAEPAPTAATRPVEDTRQQRIQQLIKEVSNVTLPTSATATPSCADDIAQRDKTAKTESWRNLPLAKQMKLYENTLHPTVMHMVKKFYDKLPKDDLKRFAREVSKNLVNSDYKHKRVTDPTTISDNQIKKVKQYVYEFFTKAVRKHREQEVKKTSREVGSRKNTEANGGSFSTQAAASTTTTTTRRDDLDCSVSDAETLSEFDATPCSTEKKRKREDQTESQRRNNGCDVFPDSLNSQATLPTPAAKRLKEYESPESHSMMSPPPPPPPPPPEEDDDTVSLEDNRLADEKRKAEEELRKENEEAMRDEMDGVIAYPG